ncbi:RNA-directed DNA methylation 4 isoform X2 [Hordeum vulgare subsp. vulgare]|uniref:RNA-directed DNA methylation 4 isoform X2 n=1 Tax=Hordeum vulgare subsp. vulgare TaxID=112509 RepID=UPI0002949220|nr:RNA-directed DNA methylation 4 isoform X2 [Hordeum vulgare subsp. vulgare]
MASAAEAAGEASTSAAEVRDKPVVVRVKRKPSQARPDAFWLEINERPMKKAMLDFSSLSISQPSSTAQEEPRVKKLLVQHVETVHHSGAVEDVLHSLLHSGLSTKEIKSKTKERNERMKQDKKQDQLRSAARQRHENLGRNARFAQIWKSRKGDNNEADETLREMCHLYDAVQVDSDGEKHPAEPQMTSVEEGAILCNFLPLLREHLPSAAEEIESDIISLAQSEDSDVYDIYTVKEVDDTNMECASAAAYPLLQVDDEDGECYDDDEYPYDTDDSNAEDNPLYDYPEEQSEDEDDSSDENPFADVDGSGSEYENEEVEKSNDDDDDEE